MFKSLLLLLVLTSFLNAENSFCKIFEENYLETSVPHYEDRDLLPYKPCVTKKSFSEARSFGEALNKKKRYRAAAQIFEWMSQNTKSFNGVEISVGLYYESYLGIFQETKECYSENVLVFTETSFDTFILENNMTTLMHFSADDEAVFKSYLIAKSSNIDTDIDCLKYIPMLALEMKLKYEDLKQGEKYWYRMVDHSYENVRHMILNTSKKEFVQLLLYGKEKVKISREYKIRLKKRQGIKRAHHLLYYYFYYKNGNGGCGFSNCYEIG